MKIILNTVLLATLLTGCGNGKDPCCIADVLNTEAATTEAATTEAQTASGDPVAVIETGEIQTIIPLINKRVVGDECNEKIELSCKTSVIPDLHSSVCIWVTPFGEAVGDTVELPLNTESVVLTIELDNGSYKSALWKNVDYKKPCEE